MELTPAVQDLTAYCEPLYEKAESVIHQWSHIIRTARGAVWFVAVSGGTEREEQLAYTAGVWGFAGKSKKDFEQVLLSFKLKGTPRRKWVREMRDYIAGKKFQYFHKLLE